MFSSFIRKGFAHYSYSLSIACVFACWTLWLCVCRHTHHPKSSAGKGTVHSSCVQVSCPDLFIYIHLHAVKRSRRWQPPEPTVCLDPGPILSAWIRSTVKRGTGKAHSRDDQPQRKNFTGLSYRGQTSACTNDLQVSSSEDKIRRDVRQFACRVAITFERLHS